MNTEDLATKLREAAAACATTAKDYAENHDQHSGNAKDFAEAAMMLTQAATGTGF